MISKVKNWVRDVDDELLAKIEVAHYDFQSLIYMPIRTPLSGGTFFQSVGNTDPEWNHLGLIRCAEDAFEDLLLEAEDRARAASLPLTVAVSPWTDPADAGDWLCDRGWDLSFRHRWAVMPRLDPDEFTDFVRPVRDGRDLEDFLDIFEAGFETEQDYRPVLEPSARNKHPDFEVVHFLADLDGRAAGAATAVYGRGLMGVYNLAVLPHARRRGLGAALMKSRRAFQTLHNPQLGFIQSEEAYVSEWHHRNGFHFAFYVEGWTKP